jgi:hypothetical protein
MCTVFCRGNQKERDHWSDPNVDGKIILKWMEGRNVHRCLVGKPEVNIHWGDPGVDRSIILRWMEVRDVHSGLVGKSEGNGTLV